MPLPITEYTTAIPRERNRFPIPSSKPPFVNRENGIQENGSWQRWQRFCPCRSTSVLSREQPFPPLANWASVISRIYIYRVRISRATRNDIAGEPSGQFRYFTQRWKASFQRSRSVRLWRDRPRLRNPGRENATRVKSRSTRRMGGHGRHSPGRIVAARFFPFFFFFSPPSYGPRDVS